MLVVGEPGVSVIWLRDVLDTVQVAHGAVGRLTLVVPRHRAGERDHVSVDDDHDRAGRDVDRQLDGRPRSLGDVGVGQGVEDALHRQLLRDRSDATDVLDGPLGVELLRIAADLAEQGHGTVVDRHADAAGVDAAGPPELVDHRGPQLGIELLPVGRSRRGHGAIIDLREDGRTEPKGPRCRGEGPAGPGNR